MVSTVSERTSPFKRVGIIGAVNTNTIMGVKKLLPSENMTSAEENEEIVERYKENTTKRGDISSNSKLFEKRDRNNIPKNP